MKKNAKITHNTQFITTFEPCKNILINNRFLQYLDFSKPFVLTLDASNVALGAVLSQGLLGKDKPIAYASRTLNETEQKYSTIEKELLAIVCATKYFRPISTDENSPFIQIIAHFKSHSKNPNQN